MDILALDQATLCGYAVVRDNGERIESGTWRLADTKRTGESRGMRYLRFRHALLDILDKYPEISLICHEQTLLRGGAATEIANSLKGVILMVAAERGLEVSCVHTTELKKWATGSGTADKADMIESAWMLSGHAPVDDNEADALLIGLWASSIYGTFPMPHPARKSRKGARVTLS